MDIQTDGDYTKRVVTPFGTTRLKSVGVCDSKQERELNPPTHRDAQLNLHRQAQNRQRDEQIDRDEQPDRQTDGRTARRMGQRQPDSLTLSLSCTHTHTHTHTHTYTHTPRHSRSSAAIHGLSLRMAEREPRSGSSVTAPDSGKSGKLKIDFRKKYQLHPCTSGTQTHDAPQNFGLSSWCQGPCETMAISDPCSFDAQFWVVRYPQARNSFGSCGSKNPIQKQKRVGSAAHEHFVSFQFEHKTSRSEQTFF